MCCALVALAFLVWRPDLPLLYVTLLLCVVGTAIGLVYPVTTVSIQNAVPHHQVGIAMGALNFFRSLASAFVVAVMGAILLAGLGATPRPRLGVGGGDQHERGRRRCGAGVPLGVPLGAGSSSRSAWSFLILMEERPLRGTTVGGAGAAAGVGGAACWIAPAGPSGSPAAAGRRGQRAATIVCGTSARRAGYCTETGRTHMLQSISTRFIGILLAATVAAGAAGLIASIVPEARAESTTASAQAVTAIAQPAKDDRLATRGVDACQGWPNLDQSCINRSDGKARKVRVIAIIIPVPNL